MGRLHDATQAAIERKNAVVKGPDGEPLEYDESVMRRIFSDFDIDFEELDTFVRQAIDHALERMGKGELATVQSATVDAIGDTVTNCLLTGLYHERMRADGSRR